ncbi:MAG: type II toxin-antitoxin system prevent-host-death family antitoxin [Leptolyngbya sp. RL_3_1]|nr:type II toxin-antitoxin system prevent-host-death family antitoxin [Leptolyngbya sp. RL_3_1]
MDRISLSTFTASLTDYVERIIRHHTPIQVTGDQGKDFVVISAEDWSQEQETLYILQNNTLIQQIAASMTTHASHQGYSPSSEEIDEIFSV